MAVLGTCWSCRRICFLSLLEPKTGYIHSLIHIKLSPRNPLFPTSMLGTIALVLSALTLSPAVFAFDYKDYDNDFLDPSYILSKNFNASTAAAQQSIIEWADVLAEQGPWCKSSGLLQFIILSLQLAVAVMNKSVLPPTGNKHDYLSWAP